MKYEATPAEKSTVRITMTFTPEEWQDAINKAYLENRKKYSVNGFRKGKAPRHVLEMYYGKGLFFEDALNGLFSDHYEEILEKEEANFTAVGDPRVELGENFSEENVVLVATTPVRPEVTITAYTGIKITRFEYTVTDADVERELNAARERIAESVEVSDRPAALNDTVNIDFVGKADGKEFEGGSAKGYDLVLGSGQFIPGFEDQIVGMNIGEVRDVNVTFPEDYQAEELKGKPAVFTVTLNKITGKVLPALDDEFAKKMGSESLEAYTAKVRERLERNASVRSTNDTENSILAEIAKNTTAEIPDAMIENGEEMSMRQLENNLMQQGIRVEDYMNYLGTTREEYKKNFEESARRNVMHQLIIEEIIKRENITATDEEISAKIAEQAASIGREPAEYEKTMDPRQRAYIESDIKVTKLFDFLMANNEMVLFTEEKREETAAKPAAKKTAAKKTAKKEE